MAMSDKDRRTLEALAAAREQYEKLADLLDFYYDLYEVQFRAKGEGLEPEVRDELAMRWRLEGGIPQLTFDQLAIEPEPFEQVVAQVAEVLLRHNPAWEIEQKDWTAEGLLALAQEVFETWDTLTSPRPDAEEEGESRASNRTALAVGFALAPYLQRAAEVILPLLDLSKWGQGYCPICSGRPNFALLDEEHGARKLMCSRCASLWAFSRLACPFCETEERSTYYAGDDDLYRLYVCPACKHYVKTVDLRKARRVIQPMVERLLTVSMDLAAQQAGYRS
jgi:formate dehydrogenase maturation protein FdhE